MDTSINILHLEDDPADAELVKEALAAGNLSCNISLVQTQEEFSESLKRGGFDIILSDYKIPMFDGMSAMLIAMEYCSDIPFIFVSGTMGEDAAIETLTHGATDYVLKNKITRIVPAVMRAFQEIKNSRERKRIDSMIHVRLHLLEKIYSSDISLDETCTMLINEIELQTGSEIGFFHFIDENQNTIFLQCWSSNTLATMCTAEGTGTHYDISQGGVWTDCIYQRRPVIHNDYASLPHRKGFPKGHAPVIRELVVPIIRGDKIEAIIGVGNKPTAYDETDVQIVSLLGDFSWEIIRRKRTEDALRKSEERYRMVFENSPVSIWEEDFSAVKSLLDNLRTEGVIDIGEYMVHHPEFIRQCAEKVKIIDVNNAALTLHLAKNKEELLDGLIKTFTPESFDAFRQELLCMWNGISQLSSDTIVKTLDGDSRQVTIYFSVCPGYENSLSKIIVSLIDITEKKKLEDQLRQAQKMEAIGVLAGGVAHDFNNILMIIMGCGDILKMKMKSDDPLRSIIDRILAAAKRGAHLTQGLLAFSRKQIISPKLMDVNAAVIKIEKLLRHMIGEDIEIITHITNQSLVIMADAVQIDQILMNLATNARDAMPEGGLLTFATEKVSMKDGIIDTSNDDIRKGYVRITVTDTGIGMDEKTLEKIFEPFYTTKEIGKGTGLGLAIVYGIIKQHKGDIIVNSGPGEGTTFIIYLPLIEEVIEKMNDDELLSQRGGSETILLAEDDPQIREVNASILRDFGYRIIEAVNGQDALDKFQEHAEEIDIMVLDVIMPKMSGKEVSDTVKTKHPHIPILFISGYTSDIIQKKGVLEERENFLSKPASSFDLLSKIRQILDSER